MNQDIRVGSKVEVTNGRATVRGKVTSAVNYRDSKGDDWYLMLQTDNGASYVKQRYDNITITVLPEE